MVVPAQAVQTGQDGQFVFVVKRDRPSSSGRSRPASASSEDVVIEKGLKPGETVVTEGQLRLEPGTRVRPTPAAAPADAAGGRGRGGRGRDAAQRTVGAAVRRSAA